VGPAKRGRTSRARYHAESRLSRRLLQALLIVALVAGSAPPRACGPYIPEALFTIARRPDFPLSDYAAGRLGIVQRNYDRSFLVVAYRHLSGAPLTTAETSTFLHLWGELRDAAPPSVPERRVDWLAAWQAEATRVLGKEALADQRHLSWSERGIVRYEQHAQTFLFYYNCLADAFRTAIDTLHERERQFGVGSAPVVHWTAAQNRVFANCAARGSVTAAVLPDPPSADDPPLVRADRAYQIAAAHFYARELDTASSEFGAIASDASSPWHPMAALLAARTLVRRGTLSAEPDAVIASDLEAAASRLTAMLDDPGSQALHGAARRLRGFIDVRLRSAQRRTELGRVLSRTGEGDREQDLRDYLWLLDGSRDDTAAADDLTDWIATFQSASAQAFPHAIARWRESASPAWLVAALVTCPALHADAAALLEAALRLPRQHPGKAMADFHRARLLAAAGRSGEARRQIDEVLGERPPALTVSARNQLLALRLRLARTLAEFLRFAPRTPVAVSYDVVVPVGSHPFDGRSSLPQDATYFDRDAAFVLNRVLSIATLAKVARDETLPAHLRREMATAAWTRAVAIGRLDFAKASSALVGDLLPEMAADLEHLRNAGSPEELRFAAAYTLLRHPGLVPYVATGYPRGTPLERIDALRRNWWCGHPSSGTAAPGYRPFAVDSGAGIEDPDVSWASHLPFVTTREERLAKRETQALDALDAAPDVLGREVLDWSAVHPQDPRVPEALHLVVRATRYGCTDERTSELSRKAFERLHRQYPDSVWTRRTPYWF
jgi:hypothetical protein